MRPSTIHDTTVRALLVLAIMACSAIRAPALVNQDSYGYVRTMEGYSDLVKSRSNEVVELTTNYPIIEGDQVRVSDQGRLEAVLPDGSTVRLGHNSQVEFRQLAFTADSASGSTLLLFHQGEAQLVLSFDAPSADYFRIDSVNATVYLEEEGRYRIFSDGSSWTEVTVRQGSAEVVTEGESIAVGPGQTLFIEGSRDPALEVGRKTELTSLEIWGDQLTQTADRYASEYVDPSLAYSSTPLYRHGTWLQMESGPVWRPRAPIGWRPYRSGWWGSSPSGLTWISTEPWGWLTYHYGVWDYASPYGWVWYPGQRYTPAAVYWYWGPTHVGWIPAGYYDRCFRSGSPRYIDPYTGLTYEDSRSHGYGRPIGAYPHRIGFGARLGGYGSPLADEAFWKHWSFTRHDRIGVRDGYRHFQSPAELSHAGVFSDRVPEGVLAGNTKTLTPKLWAQPYRAMEILRRSQPRSLARQAAAPRPAPGPREVSTSDRARIPTSTSATRPWTGRTQQTGRNWGSDLRQSRLSRVPRTSTLSGRSSLSQARPTSLERAMANRSSRPGGAGLLSSATRPFTNLFSGPSGARSSSSLRPSTSPVRDLSGPKRGAGTLNRSSPGRSSVGRSSVGGSSRLGGGRSSVAGSARSGGSSASSGSRSLSGGGGSSRQN